MDIRTYRKQKGLTQAELGEAVGVTATVISRYESGAVTPPPEKLVRIARILGVSTDDLIGGEMSSEEKRESMKSFAVRYDDDFSKIAIRHFSSLNLNIEKTSHPFPFSLISKESGKIWCLDPFSMIDPTLTPSRIERKVYECIGISAFQSINKFSIITDISLNQCIATLHYKIQPDALGFDVSIIHVNLDEQRFDGEYELVTHFDGRGYFDLAVPGKEAESARLFAAWQSSLYGPNPKTNA